METVASPANPNAPHTTCQSSPRPSASQSQDPSCRVPMIHVPFPARHHAATAMATVRAVVAMAVVGVALAVDVVATVAAGESFDHDRRNING